MSLGPGSSLGPFKIQSLLGKGGMGEVYSAVDTRLDRKVAIKVLPPNFTTDSDRLRRFQSEAKTLASLNHPNILVIHDVGTENSQSYLVSELLEGRTLREELGSGHLPVRKALDYALQIAQGLAAAHARGIIHRDLKPENIFVTKEGRVKILDFGLAKLAFPFPLGGERDRVMGESMPSETPTLLQSTVPGLILGTPGYMSPEQVRGEPTDHRSDIFAFGCVLYEMLGRKRPFQKLTAAETLTAILKEEPPELPEQAGPGSELLRQIVLRCLEKEPGRRFQTVSDLAFAVQSTATGPSNYTPSLPPSRPPTFRLPQTLFAAAVIFAVGVAFMLGRKSNSAPLRSKPPVTAWRGERLDGPAVAFSPRLSPDGREIAFQTLVDGQSQLGLMLIETGDWKVLTTNRSRGLLDSISWSRDGSQLYYGRYSGQPMGVYRISKYGGEERLVLESATSPIALPNGSLVVARAESWKDRELFRLYLYSQTEELKPLDAFSMLGMISSIALSPDERSLIMWGLRTNGLANTPNFWRIELPSGRVSLVASNLPSRVGLWDVSPFTLSRDARQFVFAHPSANLHRLYSYEFNSGEVKPLLPLTANPTAIDLDPEENLIVDQTERPSELLRREPSGMTERFPLGPFFENRLALPLSNNRFVFAGMYRDQNRLMILDQGRERTFLDTMIDSGPPFALLGSDQLLFTIQETNQLILASATLDGRNLRRFPAITWSRGVLDSPAILSVAGSPDGKTIYYSREGAIFSMPASGGEAKKVCPGHSVAVSPDGRYLIAKVNATPDRYLIRVSLSDGAIQRLSHPANLPLTVGALAPNAVAARWKDCCGSCTPR